MGASNLLTRIPRLFRKSLTFSNATGSGEAGTVKLGTVTGRVLILRAAAYCITSLTADGAATIELGQANDTAGLLAQITATDLDAGEFWEAAPSPIAAAVVDKAVAEGDLNVTVATANLTAGKVEFAMYWLPLSDDGNIA